MTNNTVSSNQYSGIRLDFGSSSNVLSNNTVNSNGERGILIVKSSGNVLRNNILVSNRGEGIAMFHHLDPSGISQSFDNKAIGNIIIDNGEYGIYTSADRNTIVNNIANGNRYGITVASDGNVINNTANYNLIGFILDHFSSNFTNNVANSNNQTGISFTYTFGANISNNIANMNNQTGIFIQGAGPQQNIIADNIANSNGQNGIYTYASGKNNIRNNIVNSNGLYGILVYSYAEDNLTNNTANSNGFAGISLSGTNNNNLVNNTASSNYIDGLSVDQSSQNKITANTFCANSFVSGYDLNNMWVDNYGDDNTCDSSSNWYDTGVTGCTYLCSSSTLFIVTESLPSGALGKFSSHKLKAVGVPPYSWVLVNGTLPAGMVLYTDGILNGTPTNAGTFTFRVRANDSNNSMAEKIFTKIVYVTLPPAKLSIHKWGTAAVPGRIMDYFIAVTNIDNALPAENVTIMELLEPSIFNLTFANPPASVIEYSDVRHVVWNISLIGLGDTRILNYKAKLNSSTKFGSDVIGGPACYPSKDSCNCEDFVSWLGLDACHNSTELDNLIACIKEKMNENTPPIQTGSIFTYEGGHSCGPSMHFGGKCADLGIGSLAVDYGLGVNNEEILFGDRVREIAIVDCGAGLAECEDGKNFVSCNSRTSTHVHIEVYKPECGGSKGTGMCVEHKQPAARPRDPNEKGVLNDKFINSNETLTYTVHFENVGNASAAENVFVNDSLDPNLDASTIELFSPNGTFIPISNGQTLRIFNQTKNQTLGNGTINISIEENWMVSLNGRMLFWNLSEIFLPINETGTLIYSVKPIQGLQSGTVIKNNANIQFETFENVTTNNTINIIDDISPRCTVNPLPNESKAKDFTISWNGSDEVGEIEGYTIFVSTNNNSYVPLINRTSDMSFNFTGEKNKTYEFICIATDTAGNVEIQDPVAEAYIYVLLGVCGDVNNDGVHNVLDVVKMINVAFRGQNQTNPPPFEIWDVDSSGAIDIIDVVKIINVAFRGQSPESQLTCQPVSAVQASATITIQKTSDGFSASSNLDRDIAGMQFDLTYDPAKIIITKVNPSTRTSEMTITNTQISPGKNKIAIYSSDGGKSIKYGSGVLFTVQTTGSDFSSLKIIPKVVDYKTSNGFSDAKVDFKFKTIKTSTFGSRVLNF
ncbi:right-handed parallel beta-helix repeat-containing protein [Candidatus Pacearchaeota archaeon]|nr:right-handed parallel beta-helix repeat-containing protein [Candidatus Pacearchaeota archaeon]